MPYAQTEMPKNKKIVLYNEFFPLIPIIFCIIWRILVRKSAGLLRKVSFARVAAWDLEQYFFEEVNAVAEGTVKWFSEQKGYGFIEQDEGGDIFVHHSEINMAGFRTLAEGDRVSFEVGEGTKGPAAKNVTKV